jgi:hypothetical protein
MMPPYPALPLPGRMPAVAGLFGTLATSISAERLAGRGSR